MQGTIVPQESAQELNASWVIGRPKWRRLLAVSRYWKALVILFIATLPFIHGEVEGDGIGYYAYLRSPLIDHNLSFAGDWKDASAVERLVPAMDWKDPQEVDRNAVRHVWENPVRRPGHLPNYFTVGPAILWSPFIVSTHAVVLTLNHIGTHIAADGKSRPYMVALGFATALYGFLGLCLAFSIAKKFAEECWSFWATIGVWMATSLPVYMYLHTSWSHAPSAFATSLFLWYWLRTRPDRSTKQWIILGVLGGLMIEVYYLNVVFIFAPLWEAAGAYIGLRRGGADKLNRAANILRSHGLCLLGALLALTPTFITRQIVFGNPFTVGPYSLRAWNWTAPAFGKVLFSSSHGLLVFTPIVLLAFVGLFCLYRLDRTVGLISLASVLAFYALVSFYPGWSGVFGFGNRYFVSLTPLFVLGLACLLAFAERFWRDANRASLRLVPLILIFVIWNLGLVYQWATHQIPARSAVYWDEVIYTQFHEVPRQAVRDLLAKLSIQSN